MDDTCTKIPWDHPWKGDDFDPCFRKMFLESALPATVLTVSVLSLVLATIRHYRNRHSASSRSQSLLGSTTSHTRNAGAGGVGYGSTGNDRPLSAESETDPDDSDTDDNTDAQLLSSTAAAGNHQPQTSDSSNICLPPSTRDVLLAIMCVAQVSLAYVLFSSGHRMTGEITRAELALWAWTAALCVYLFIRASTIAPSPSPYLRLAFTAGLIVDFFKARTALLAYSRGNILVLPTIEMAMLGVAIILFFASFTQQRRRHGMPSYAPADASQSHPAPPEKTASIAQLLFFSWMDPMIWLGYKRSLEPSDVYDLMPEDQSSRVCAKWRREGREYLYAHNGVDNRSLVTRLFHFFRYHLFIQCIWTLANTIFIFTGPFLLRRILSYMEDPTIYTREQAFWCVAGLLLGGTVASVCQSQTLWVGRKIGIQLKSIIIGEVYSKSLRRIDAATGDDNSNSNRNEEASHEHESNAKSEDNDKDEMTSLGKITNLMAVDAHKISELCSYLHFLYQMPAEIIIAIMMLYQNLGWAAIAGLGAIVALVPFQWYLISIWTKYQEQLMKASDKRMSMTNELLQGVRIIKFFAWEPQFERQVAGVRNKELGVLWKRYIANSFSIVVFFMAPVFVTLTTFAVYTKVLGHQLTASVAFTALALFKTLRGPIDQFPDFIAFTLQAKISVERVSKFLDEEETPKYELSKKAKRMHSQLRDNHGRRASYAQVVSSTDIGFIGASFSWKHKRPDTISRPSTRGSSNRHSRSSLGKMAGSEEPLLASTRKGSTQTSTSSGSCSGVAVSETTDLVETTSTEDDNFELRDLTANFPVGKLSIIAGPTGSGKTSLLMALLGEMRLTDGQLMVPGASFNAHHALVGKNPQDPFALQESVAYIAQQAWLLNDTIRGNITFGLPFDSQRYKEVLRMCALTRDLEILDAGDMTEVGERGVTLSGGQKQRVCLARAVYSPARHVIMDDCLSAVDAHTAKHLYENCVMAPLMAERTRILVTHAVGLTIKGASMVLVLQEGQIAAAGTPMEVLRSGKLSEETLREGDEEQQNAAARAEATDKKGKTASNPDPSDNAVKQQDKTIEEQLNGANKASKDGADNKQGDSQDDKGRLTSEEGWSRGHVQWRVYITYIKASGGLVFWSALALMFLLTQGLQVVLDWWLREWAASYSNNNNSYNVAGLVMSQQPAVVNGGASGSDSFLQTMWSSVVSDNVAMTSLKQQFTSLANNGGNKEDNKVDLTYFIGVYAAIAIACVVVILVRSFMQFWSSLRASKEMHESLLHTIMRAPVRFFDTTPVGRLINRFSKDMETIDQTLSSSLAIFLSEVIASLAILVVISVITPAFTLGAILISGIYWVIGVLYLSASREIKRFESVTKSPIYTQFGETLNGISTIRAYGQENRFKKINYHKIDDNIRPFIYMWGANRWLSIRVDIAGALVSFMAGLLALTTTGRMDAGLAGLSLSYALNFTEHILWVVRFYSINEMNLNSVERVVEYLDVEPEAPVSIPDRVPPPQWPTEGRISVENLVLTYSANLPPVIRGVSFEVNPREKVGIVGRTGAGKSTLTLAMFRFMEAASGRIVVDGLDISQMGVGDLRSQLTIIPQDPVLFAGTIRSNLDPFNEYGEDALWLALRRAHLLGDEEDRSEASGSQQQPLLLTSSSSRVSTMADKLQNEENSDGGVAVSRVSSSVRVVALGRTITGLDMPVKENGSNFSQGQRQLIALARALVKRTRVIILDEATASVDFDTDAKIQATIRNEFTESTLLCIAHRLRTIVDYDRVLVLDQGKIVEYDTPYNLLSKNDGLFKHMCLKSGEYNHLFSAAERKHHETH